MTPLSRQDEWSIDACLHNEGNTTGGGADSGDGGGTMFMDIRKAPQRDYPNSDLFTYYGYKFEAVCTSTASTAEGYGVNTPESSAVDSTSEFALLLSLRLGSHSVLMAAEVDCCSDPSKATATEEGCSLLIPGDFMELKTIK